MQARIEDGGQLLFTTTQAYLVITQGRPTTIDVTLTQVDGPEPFARALGIARARFVARTVRHPESPRDRGGAAWPGRSGDTQFVPFGLAGLLAVGVALGAVVVRGRLRMR